MGVGELMVSHTNEYIFIHKYLYLSFISLYIHLNIQNIVTDQGTLRKQDAILFK